MKLRPTLAVPPGFCRSILLFFATFLSFPYQSMAGLSVEITGRSQQCFYELLHKRRHVHVEVFTTHSQSGSLTIQLQVKGPQQDYTHIEKQANHIIDSSLTGSILYEPITSDRNIAAPEPYQFTTEFDGMYELCLINDEAGTKQVQFDMINQKPDHRVEAMTLKERKKHASTEHLSHVEQSFSNIGQLITECSELQMFHRQRESVHRNTVESNNSRAQWYTIVEFVILGIVLFAQIYVMQRWFRDFESEPEGDDWA